MIQKIVLLVALLFAHSQGAYAGPTRVGSGRCDRDYVFLDGDKEVNQQCYESCYREKYKCNSLTTSIWLRSRPLAARSLECREKCIDECNRCEPEGFDQRAHQPSCPEPQCLVKIENYQMCRSTCGGLSKREENALTRRYSRLKLETGVVGTNNICSIFCNCKFYGPKSFPWRGESLCANLTPLPNRRLKASLYDYDYDSVW